MGTKIQDTNEIRPKKTFLLPVVDVEDTSSTPSGTGKHTLFSYFMALDRNNDGVWEINPYTDSYTSSSTKIVINGSNFISDGGDSGWTDIPNGYGRYNLYIGDSAADNLTVVTGSTYEVNTGVGYGVFKDSVGLSFMTTLGGGSGRSITRDESPEYGVPGASGVLVGSNAGRNISAFNTSVGVGSDVLFNSNRVYRTTVVGNAGAKQSGYLYKATMLGSFVAYDGGNYEHCIAIGHESLLTSGGTTSNSILIGDYTGINKSDMTNSIIIGHYRKKGQSYVELGNTFSNIISIGDSIIPLQEKTINVPLDYDLGLGTHTPEGKLDINQATASTPSIITRYQGVKNYEVSDKGVFTKNGVYSSEVNNGNSGSTYSINWRNGSHHTSTLTDNCTFSFTDPYGSSELVLKIVQDGTGARLITWPSNVKWIGGSAPVLSLGANAVDLIGLYFDGTNYYERFVSIDLL